MRSYEAARSLFSVISFFSWFLIAGGIILIFVGGNMGSDLSRFNRAPEIIGLVMGAVPGLATTIIGFFSLVMSQLGRASVDSAEYGQQMLQIARDQLDVSRQTLHKGDALRQSFEALSQRTGMTSTASYAGHLTPAEARPDQNQPPDNPASQPALIAYKGKEIAALDSSFHYAGTSFPTLADAQAQIDLLASDTLRPASDLRAVRP